MNFTNEYITPIEIAQYIHVSPITVRKWLREGEIPYTKFGRVVRVKTRDFEAYCKANEIS